MRNRSGYRPLVSLQACNHSHTWDSKFNCLYLRLRDSDSIFIVSSNSVPLSLYHTRLIVHQQEKLIMYIRYFSSSRYNCRSAISAAGWTRSVVTLTLHAIPTRTSPAAPPRVTSRGAMASLPFIVTASSWKLCQITLSVSSTSWNGVIYKDAKGLKWAHSCCCVSVRFAKGTRAYLLRFQTFVRSQ